MSETTKRASEKKYQELFLAIDEADLFIFKCQGITNFNSLASYYGLSKAIEIVEGRNNE